MLAFTERLITKTNEIQFQITKNDSAKIIFPYSQKEVFQMNLNGYNNLAKEHPYFNYKTLPSRYSFKRNSTCNFK